jgi:diaminohydroxyphosphoribosylaminopyrimidine deaminase / 5-amino-6-(5-phosphoribosylamino)uracil reductase
LNDDYSKFDLEMSRKALDLAAEGIGQVSPSPLVGCVIVAGEQIVGEGIYLYKDITHAEVIALNQAGEKAKGGTAYVSLEPHVHHGRTPPCTDALINAGISRVVCPIEDPNPLVSGKGFEALRERGIEVVTGILKETAERQNEKFIYWHRKGRPFIHLKMAVSLDGRIATHTGDSKWITGAESRERVQRLRHEYDAILVGGNTVAADDPSLTDRSGLERHRNLMRVVLDNALQTSLDAKIVRTAKEFPTLIYTSSEDSERIESLSAAGVELLRTSEGGNDLHAVLENLAERGIISVLVEGGAEVAGSFFDKGLIDKVSFFIAPKIIGGREALSAVGGTGIEKLSDARRLEKSEVFRHGDDLEFTGYPVC